MILIPFCNFGLSLAGITFEIALVTFDSAAMPLLINLPTPGMNLATTDAAFCTVATIFSPNLATLAMP